MVLRSLQGLSGVNTNVFTFRNTHNIGHITRQAKKGERG